MKKDKDKEKKSSIRSKGSKKFQKISLKKSQPNVSMKAKNLSPDRTFSKFGGGRVGRGDGLVNGNKEILGRMKEVCYVYFHPGESCLFLFHWNNPKSGYNSILVLVSFSILLKCPFTAPQAPNAPSHPPSAD